MNPKILHFFIAFFSLEDIGNFFNSLWNGLTEGFKSAFESITDFANWLWEHTIGYLINLFLSAINSIWQSIQDFFTSIGETISSWFYGVFQAIANAIYQYIINPIVGFFSFLANLPFPFNFLSYVGIGLAIVLGIATAWNIIKRFIPVLGGWL
ncbi:hypothetical protein J7K27_01235 [Candidatus Bathyarchaeota archaeon]|nr:hypothetical protein [Candidatus Bathyarchaeota archaeon]